MNHEHISNLIRDDFGILPQFKTRGETLEVVSPACMANRDIVSVYVKEQDGGGYVCAAELKFWRLSHSQKKKRAKLMDEFFIKRKSGSDWFYRIVDKEKLIGSAIADI